MGGIEYYWMPTDHGRKAKLEHPTSQSGLRLMSYEKCLCEIFANVNGTKST